ncbi:MAG: hypothetical protein M3Z95_06675 [Actinomycetota bacterium]|nr:hypothetical protein [Actinomycetota bacterium]
MRSRQLESALTEFLDAASGHLSAELAAGAEVGFELASQVGARGRGTTPLYCYRALTGPFIAERESALRRLPGHAEAAKLLAGFDGLDRYLASTGSDAAQAKGSARAGAAIRALLEDVFADQTDFELRPERTRAALERLEHAAFANASRVTLVATLHGIAIASSELSLTKGLTIAQPDALKGMPPPALADEGVRSENHLIVVHSAEEDDAHEALLGGREVLRDLLRALRLFGDGRVTLGALAWAQVGGGGWNPLALGLGGRPRGMLVVTAEQEDELRAFCNLVSRRAPHANALAWALRRFELGCERASFAEGLSDHLLALRALLEPEGIASGLLAGRLAALCATPDQWAVQAERVAQAVALERAVIAGETVKQAPAHGLAEDVAGHLRALLRDVICGHLAPDLASLADELLAKSLEESGCSEQQARLAGEEAQSTEEAAAPSGPQGELTDELGELTDGGSEPSAGGETPLPIKTA